MNRNKYTLYMHRNIFNGKVYIGITSIKAEERWKNGHGYCKNKYFWRAINKYGWKEGFEHIILFEGLSKEVACLLEECYIALYDSANPNRGYNRTLGGESYTLTQEVLEYKTKSTQEANNKKVICLETKEIFNSINELSEELGIPQSNVSLIVNNRRRYKGYTYVLYEDYLNNNEIKSMSKYRCERIICLETKEIFNSQLEVVRTFGGNCGKLKDAIINNYIYENYSFMYYTDYLRFGEIKMKEKKNSNGGKKIICLEENKIFDSQKEAVEYINGTRQGMIKSLGSVRQSCD